MQLRRRLGLGPMFSPIPRKQRHYVRYARIAREILKLEHQLVGHLAEVNRALERRIKLRQASGKW